MFEKHMKQYNELRRQKLIGYISSYNFEIILALVSLIFIQTVINYVTMINTFNLASLTVCFIITTSLWEIFFRIKYNDWNLLSAITRLGYALKVVAGYLFLILGVITVLIIQDNIDYSRDAIIILFIVLLTSIITILLTSSAINSIGNKKDKQQIYDATFIFLGISGVMFLVIFIVLLLTFFKYIYVDVADDYLTYMKVSPVYLFTFLILITTICLYTSISLNSYLSKSRYDVKNIIEKYKKR